jgi:RNA polymerase sigma-70 factor (ECF subfamily)
MKQNYNDGSGRREKLNNYWRRWQSQGDRRAADLLVKEIFQKLVLFIRSKDCDIEDARDIVQEALLLVILNKKQKEIGNIQAYIYRVAIRLFFKSKIKKILTTSFDQELTETIPESDPDENPSDDELRNAMKKVLKDIEYQCLFLYFWEGLSHKEIGEQLGFTVSKVNTILYRARLKLADYLSGRRLGDSS